MTAQTFTYSGNIYTASVAGTVDFALTSTAGNAIAYLEKAHVHVYKSANQGTTWTELTRPAQWDFVSNGTVARLVTGIATGEWVKVQRITPSTTPYITFQASSLLTAEQLNDDTTFNTYLNQERYDQTEQSNAIATSATTTATTALSTANAATATANGAVTTANSAVSTANAASTSASSAVTTANSALTAANNAVSTANAATSTANSAVTTANSAVSTANTASSTATAASTTATNADVKADAAIAAVASSVNYTSIANVAAIPASPANNTYIEVANTTGLESFTPMAGMPVGFVGDSGLRARLRYTTAGTTWNWIDYAPTDADGRYLKKSGGTMTGALTLSGAPSSNLHAATKQYVDAVEVQAVNAQSTANTAVSNAAAAQSTANTAVSDAAAAQSTANAALPKAGGTMTGAITFAGGQTFPSSGLANASTSASGIVQLSDSTSSTSSTQAATSAAVKSVQDFASVVSTTANTAMPKTGGTFTGDVIFNTNTAATLPVGTTAQRPTGSTGMVRYNSTLGGFEGYSGSAWGSLGGGATGGGSDKVFVETDQTVTTNYTLTAGKNAMTAGPVTVASGIVVTIPSGAAWVIV